MTYGRTLGQYEKISVETAGRMDLILLCYEKAIQHLDKTRTLCKEKRYDEKLLTFDKALGIINELSAALDMEKGGEIAKNLDAIYNYLMRRLLQGDVKKDFTAYDEAIRILSDLKGAWESIASESQINKTAGRHYDPARPTSTQIAA